MIHTSVKNTIQLSFVLMLLSLVQGSFAQTTNDFGNKDWVSNGFAGKIYALPENTSQLPDFDTLKALGTIYSKEINVSARSWSEGFPGVTNRFEWFGIEYKGSFKVRKAGHYTFQLYSDDGSKLFIDDSLVIDNDGLHSPRERSGEIDLDNSTHTIKVQYYQGPRTYIALQLFAKLNSEAAEVFPGNNFKLSTPATGFMHGISNSIMIPGLVVFLLMLILTILFIRRRRNRVFQMSITPFTSSH